MDYRLKPGSSWAGYIVEAALGAGRVGETYRVRRGASGKPFALKVAWPKLAAAPNFAFSFQHQARILQRLNSPHVVAVIDSGINKGMPYCVLEYIPGPRGEPLTLRGYLAERLERGKPVEEDEAVAIALDLCSAVAAVHSFRAKKECPHGIVLGDLRPPNILIDEKTNIRIADAGFDALVHEHAPLATDTVTPTIGTDDRRDYTSPEVRRGEAADARSDVYSLGAILYELLTGQVMDDPPSPPSKVRKNLHPGWDDLLLKRCVAVNPAERFENASALKDAVQKLLDTPRTKPAAKPATIVMKKSDLGPKPSATATAGPGAGRSAPASKAHASAKPTSKAQEPTGQKSKRLWVISSSVALVGIAVTLAFGLGGTKNKKPAVAKAKPAAVATTAAAATPAPKPVPTLPTAEQAWTVPEIGIEFAWIPPGSATLGSSEADRQRLADTIQKEEAHTLKYETRKEAVISNGFWMAAAETTVAQWKRFIAANASYQTAAEKKGSALAPRAPDGLFVTTTGACWKTPLPGVKAESRHPVTCIGWSDAVLFCEWLTELERKAGRLPDHLVYRLPTETEWEYACRGGAKSVTAYWWGDDPDSGAGRLNAAGTEYTTNFPGSKAKVFAWNDGFSMTSPTEAFGDKGRNGFGLSGMIGNVWECCINPGQKEWPAIWRGGSFAEGPAIARCASVRHRYGTTPSVNAGFRVCLARKHGG